jgi:hypothetical protein
VEAFRELKNFQATLVIDATRAAEARLNERESSRPAEHSLPEYPYTSLLCLNVRAPELAFGATSETINS